MNTSSSHRRQVGFSLLEGLTILLIVSVLVTIGTPNFSSAIERSRATSHVNDLIATLNLARTYAITENSSTILCASASGGQCDGHWEQGRILFIDRNGNRKLDVEENIVERGYPLGDDIKIRWQASGGRNRYVRFSRHGTAMEFGRFTYCPRNNKVVPARMLILNRMGRVKIAKDSNGDGIVEDTKGRMPSC